MAEINEQLSLDIDGIKTIMLDRQTDRQTDRQPQTLEEKIEKATNVLRLAADMSKTYYGAPLILTYSGGKDSDVMLRLAENCLQADAFEVLNSHTSVDAPETVYHIREVFKRLENKDVKTTINYPKDANGNHETMWTLIPKKKMPPTRVMRYCCQTLKETSTPNRLAALGVRASESSKRQGRDTFGIRGGRYSEAMFFSFSHTEEVHQEAKELNDPVWDCTLIKNMRERNDCIVNPIYEWTDSDIWDYIKAERIQTNPLYERGYKRVGCIGCPMAGYAQVQKEFSEYPTYKQAYIKAFDNMLKRFDTSDATRWQNGEDVFNWWTEEYLHNVKGQMSLFD